MNEGLFLFKYLLVLGAFIGFLWVNNSVFEAYAIAAKYISIVYMVLQSIILIDLFYMLAIGWVKKYNDGQNCYGGYLIFWTIVFEAAAVFMNVYGYIRFSSTDDGQCTSLIWVNVITSVIIIVLPLFQICQWNQQNSLLTTALVSLYISYLTFIAQFSYDGLCNVSFNCRLKDHQGQFSCRYWSFNFSFHAINVWLDNGRIRASQSYC
jgi:hypothetical protein